MAVLAMRHIRRMRGGAQAQLMLGSDQNLWVVKFQNNPQHRRVLVNEMFATELAALAGLTVPQTAAIEVSSQLIESTPELEVDLGGTRVPCSAGLHFGAQYVGGLMPGHVMDELPERQLEAVRNLPEFAGILALDKWTENIDRRQAVFFRTAQERRYSACFIDQGYCFHAAEWKFDDAPLRGVYPRNHVYWGVVGWDSFEPWLTRMERMDPELVWRAAKRIPPEWYAGRAEELEALVETVLRRRVRIRELVEQLGRSQLAPFPNWSAFEKR